MVLILPLEGVVVQARLEELAAVTSGFIILGLDQISGEKPDEENTDYLSRPYSHMFWLCEQQQGVHKTFVSETEGKKKAI